MQTVITSKFQTTIPKKIREQLNLSIKDTLDWRVKGGEIVVSPIQNTFLSFRNSIKVGPGDIEEDILQARDSRMEKYK